MEETQLYDMKKFLYGFLMLVMCITVSSCGKDDDGPKDSNSILGEWRLVSSMDDGYWGNACYFNFRDNNMLTITFGRWTADEEAVPCRYYISGSKLTIDFAYGEEVYEGTYKIEGNVLTFDMISYSPDNPSNIYIDYLTLVRN